LPHDHDLEHEHDEHNHILWKRDRIELRSVGIDVGSSTSHLVFSTLELRRQSAALSSRFELAKRRVDYASAIFLTPFLNGTSIDTLTLSDFFKSAYEAAGLAPSDVDTGAVITTGDAARKDNAEAIVRLFAQEAGKFVCASAGPLLEAKMAAYGSGAVARSTQGHHGARVLNIDIGGGTSKLALVAGGQVLDLAAINVGARLVTFNSEGLVTKIEHAAAVVARHLKLDLRIGRTLGADDRRTLAMALARSLLAVAARQPLPLLAAELIITTPLPDSAPVDAVMFSGGVAEYIYAIEPRAFGDLGLLLAQSINALMPEYMPGIPVERSVERIRATVIGASQFTVQVSGNTIYIANPRLLPLRGFQVVTAVFDGAEPTPSDARRIIRQALDNNEITGSTAEVALAIRWHHGPGFRGLGALAAGIADAMTDAVRAESPVVLVLDSDLARLVGAELSRQLAGYRNIVCIDGVQLQDFDYVDISEEHPDAHVVTVVIKSLVFTG
jgi:ethanolamine utilization protein EutA